MIRRKGSLKLTWQRLPKKVLQSSLLDSAGVQPETKPLGVSQSSFSYLFWIFRLLAGISPTGISPNLCHVLCEGSK